MRIAAGVEYDGSAYSGWQRQNDAPSVQANVESALSRVADHDVRVTCAGRTDAGVHAMGQIIHFDTRAERELQAWTLGGTANLDPGISINWAQVVDDGFHARFSAISRQYRYVIFNRPVRPALFHRQVSWEYRPLNVEIMHAAAQSLRGEHDFTSYRAVACQAKHPVRRVSRLDVSGDNGWVYIDIEANAFLHHMVRNIAGVLMAIGRGEQPEEWARSVLEKRDRTAAGVTAPAGGLYLVRVEYPAAYTLPTQPRLPVFG